jgi:hypothetical protein
LIIIITIEDQYHLVHVLTPLDHSAVYLSDHLVIDQVEEIHEVLIVVNLITMSFNLL